MRPKTDPQLYFDWSTSSSRKIVTEYRERYKAISDLLDANPEIVALAHADLRRLCEAQPEKQRSKTATYTSENMLRALIVHQLEGTGFRNTCVRLAESETLRSFCRLGTRDVPDYSFLDRCFNALGPGTWKRINEALTQYATQESRIDPSVIRTDTTVVEANIHYPTDSSLLWDGFRVLGRLLRRARNLRPSFVPHRFHERKAKGLHLFVTRYASSSSKARKREVRGRLRKLLGHVGRILGIAREFCSLADVTEDPDVIAVRDDIRHFVRTVSRVVSVVERVHVRGEDVPAKEKIFSIFEEHVELIKRGKRAKPVEFGHKIVLSQTREKFITDYEVLKKQVPDGELTEQVVERHEEQFGEPPQAMAADAGFWSGEDRMASLRSRVKTLAIPKNVRHWVKNFLPAWHRFRAGVEGTISVLKRAYRLMRCLYRGFKNFASSVGLGIFCHNLVCLASRANE